MKLESPYINPINFRNGVAELESESYRSTNILNCQQYKTTDHLQFIVYFVKDDATTISVKVNGIAIEIAKVFTSAVQETWGSPYISGFRRFNKGYLIVRFKFSDLSIANNTNVVVTVNLYNNSKSCVLTSNNLFINECIGSKLMKYSNTYNNNVCEFLLLKNLFEYRFYGLFYKTDLTADAEVFQGNNTSEVISYRTNEQYLLNIGGQDMITLEEERKIRHIFGCNVKVIDNVEYELTPDVEIGSNDLLRRSGRELNIALMNKYYKQSVMQVGTGITGTVTTDIPIKYDDTALTLAIDPASLTTITVNDSNNKAVVNKTLINSKDIVRVDFGINQNMDEVRTIDVVISDATITKTLTINQKYSGLTFGDAIMNKNLILRNL